MQQCYKCAFKHIAQASKVFDELRQGYEADVSHIGEVVGNLACAADHLLDKQPDLSNEIRSDRVEFLNSVVENPGKSPIVSPDFSGYLRVLFELMLDEERMKNGREKGNGGPSEAL